MTVYTITTPLYFTSVYETGNFTLDLWMFENMLRTKGIRYSSVVRQEIRDNILRCDTTVSMELKTLTHTVCTKTKWTKEVSRVSKTLVEKDFHIFRCSQELDWLMEFLDDQYMSCMWSHDTIRGTFYIGAPRLKSVQDGLTSY